MSPGRCRDFFVSKVRSSQRVKVCRVKAFFGAIWFSVHLLLAVGLVFIFTDRFDLINQVSLTSACEGYVKLRPSREVYSELTFALRCWDSDNAVEFFLLALVGVSICLLPFTVAGIRAVQIRSSNASSKPG